MEDFVNNDNNELYAILETSEDDVSDFLIDELNDEIILGYGSEGEVHLMEHITKGRFAVKMFDTTHGSRVKERTLERVEYIAKLNRHLNIVRVFGFVVEVLNGPKIGYLMEYMANRSLDILIHDHTVAYMSMNAMDWAYQASVALAWLHSQGIIHRDVKPSNMLMSDGYKTLKLCDFGTTRTLEKTLAMTVGVGTILYMASELLNPSSVNRYTNKCDVYSMGVTLWEMTTRREPFGTGGLNGRPDIEKVHIEDIKNLLAPCFSRSPDERPTMEHIAEQLRTLLENVTPYSENELIPISTESSPRTFKCYPDKETLESENGIVLLWNFTNSEDLKLKNSEFEYGTLLLNHNSPHDINRTSYKIVATAEAREKFSQENVGVRWFGWNHDGSLLATLSDDGIVRFWCDDGRLSCTLPSSFGIIWSLEWNPTRDLILFHCSEKVIVWDHIEQRIVQTLEFAKDQFCRMLWVGADTFLIYHGITLVAHIIGSEPPLHTYYEPDGAALWNVIFDPISKKIATIACQIRERPAQIRILNADLSVHGDWPDDKCVSSGLHAAAWMKCGHILAIFDKSDTFHLWDMRVDEPQKMKVGGNGKEYNSYSFDFTSDGTYLGCLVNESVYIWTYKSHELVKFHKRDVGGQRSRFGECVCWNHRGDKLLVSYRDGTITLIDFQRDKLSSTEPAAAVEQEISLCS